MHLVWVAHAVVNPNNRFKDIFGDKIITGLDYLTDNSYPTRPHAYNAKIIKTEKKILNKIIN